MLKKIVTTRTILFLMLFFQLMWLVGIWVTNASNNLQKLLILGGISILAFLVVNFLHTSFFEKIGNSIDWLANNQHAFIILLAVALLFGGILYANLQRVWPWDEEQNFQMSQLIAEKGLNEFFKQYASNNYLANRHPPLIFIINGLAVSVFGVNLITVRMVSLAFGFGMLVVSYSLALTLYGKRAAVLTVLLLLSFPLVIRESTAGLLDIHASMFFVLTLVLVLRNAKRPSWKLGLIIGLSLGLGLLTKYMVMFIIPLLGLYFLIRGNYRANIIPFILSFIVAGGLFLIWTWYGAKIGVRVPAVAGFSPSNLFASNQIEHDVQISDNRVIEEISISPGYFLTSTWGRSFLLNSLTTRLTSGIGFYNLPLILLGFVLLIQRRNSNDWFVIGWIGVISALLILTLPDHRYFMMVFPALAIAGSLWVQAQSSKDIGRLSFLLLVYQICALYLLVDWNRISELFITR